MTDAGRPRQRIEEALSTLDRVLALPAAELPGATSDAERSIARLRDGLIERLREQPEAADAERWRRVLAAADRALGQVAGAAEPAAAVDRQQLEKARASLSEVLSEELPGARPPAADWTGSLVAALAAIGLVVVGWLGANAMLAAPGEPARPVAGGDPARGRGAIQQYGCGACHTIPGVPRAQGGVGPPLGGIAGRAIIAGRLPNEPDAVARWIQNPQQVEPGNAMPDLGVTEAEARDITAYLYTLR